MALTLKPNCFYRPFLTLARYYCEKSIYQRNEEGTPPRTAQGKLYPEWRKPWIQREGEWKSKLSIFVEHNPSPDILNALSQVPDITFAKVKEWWKSMKILQEIHNQKFMPERVTILGSNLAALHFFTFRRAAVRLKGSPEWISGDATTLKFPSVYEEGYYVEAVDCTNFHYHGVRYEGLQNLTGLSFLKWLSLKNSKYVDVWCLDRLAGQNGKSLEYLDISGSNLCLGGVFALSRMSALKFLVVTEPGEDNLELQSALSLLEQSKPGLLIKTVDKE